MHIIVLTPVRLFGDGLTACLSTRPGITVLAVVSDLAKLRSALSIMPTHVVLIDVSQGIDLFDVRTIAVEWSDVALVALGLNEQRQDVIRCGRAGFAGYVARDATIEALCASLSEIVAGRLACPPEIAGGLLRALFGKDAPPQSPDAELSLTRRESEVLALLGRGLSNKEIGSGLCGRVAPGKHHVPHRPPRRQVASRPPARL